VAPLQQSIHFQFICEGRDLVFVSVWRKGEKGNWRNTMIRQLLAIAALAVVLAFSGSTSNAAPAANTFEALKASASEGSVVQQARHRKGHRHYRRHANCWWGDRWFCRWMW